MIYTTWFKLVQVDSYCLNRKIIIIFNIKAGEPTLYPWDSVPGKTGKNKDTDQTLPP